MLEEEIHQLLLEHDDNRKPHLMLLLVILRLGISFCILTYFPVNKAMPFHSIWDEIVLCLKNEHSYYASEF